MHATYEMFNTVSEDIRLSADANPIEAFPSRNSALRPFPTFAAEMMWITYDNRWPMYNFALAAFHRAYLKLNLKKGNLKSNLHSKYIAKTVSHASFKKMQMQYFWHLLKQLHNRKPKSKKNTFPKT